MTPDDAIDPMSHMLARLASAVPSARSVERTRAKCHAVLARQQQQQTQSRQTGACMARVLDAAIFAALCAYLTEAAREAFRLAVR